MRVEHAGRCHLTDSQAASLWFSKAVHTLLVPLGILLPLPGMARGRTLFLVSNIIPHLCCKPRRPLRLPVRACIGSRPCRGIRNALDRMGQLDAPFFTPVDRNLALPSDLTAAIAEEFGPKGEGKGPAAARACRVFGTFILGLIGTGVFLGIASQ